MRHLAAQNPSTYVGEPDIAPASDAPSNGVILLGVVVLYALAFWLIFKGPLRHWAAENTGGAWAVLAFGPGLVALLFIYATR
ncbi:hypothetical protein [Luteimonas saliphila]|uniref:hypothetical protein n=1 Tax=Luteimonas saliphila TaxID=2804919 RepID=UPI00192D3C5D|nr:hypothetical protein [Luteimonas saliphila]